MARTAAQKRASDRVREAAHAYLAEHEAELFRMRDVASKYFDAITTSGWHERRPMAGFKLCCDGTPPARVAIRPRWDRRAKQLTTSIVEAELMVEDRKADKVGSVKRDLKISLHNRYSENVQLHKWWRDESKTINSLSRICETILQFLEDPERVFARSSDHCCICGRALTDDTSRTRGIGPECLVDLRHMYVMYRGETIFGS